MPEPTIYVASAGTGKTTALMGELEQLLSHTKPEKIAFTTFTNAGAKELAHRACVKFPHLTEENFRYFRTLHSIAYRSIPHQPMMSRGDLISFGQFSGYYISGINALNAKDGIINAKAGLGDQLIAMDGLVRSRRCAFDQVIIEQSGTTFTEHQLEDFSKAYREYREAMGKYDFTDMLEQFLPLAKDLPIEALLVDEAQDLNILQWEIIDEMSKGVDRYVVAGDDKQAIYRFNGGQPEKLINMVGKREVLDTSYRLPSNILRYAEGIAGRISNKQEYTVAPVAEGGTVHRILGVNELDLSKGTWFFLGRNRAFLGWFEEELLSAGVLYETDSADAIIPHGMLETIKAWKELQKGFSVDAKTAKAFYAILKAGKSVKRGGKKRLNALNDAEFVDRDELMATYGLVDTPDWPIVFQLPDRTLDLLGALDKNNQLEETCRVKISTIHGVKGQEADNVVILPDMAGMTMRNFRSAPDDEHRVFYVGVTRAKENLFLHAPLTENFYSL
jgi:superfamily I DNA/RNA helicase